MLRKKKVLNFRSTEPKKVPTRLRDITLFWEHGCSKMHWSVKVVVIFVVIVALLWIFDLLFDYFDRKF